MLKGTRRIAVWKDSDATGRQIAKLVLKPGALSASFVRADGVRGQIAIAEARQRIKEGLTDGLCSSRKMNGKVCGRKRPCRYHG